MPRPSRQAREPAFYTALGVADTIDAPVRALHPACPAAAATALTGQGEQGAETAQALFDAYVSALDDALREMGVGDLSVGKKMRKLGEALYGRMTAYEAPLRAGDAGALADGLARNVYGPRTRRPAPAPGRLCAGRASAPGGPAAGRDPDGADLAGGDRMNRDIDCPAASSCACNEIGAGLKRHAGARRRRRERDRQGAGPGLARRLRRPS